MRHFVVTNGATLRLVNLTLANGRFKGRDGQVGAPSGGNARAGSIFNTGGNIELVSCRFLDNQVRAGDAANVGVVSLSEKAGGEAFGGAIYSVAGAVAATNCVFAGNHCVGGTGSSEFVSGDGGDAHGGAMYLTNSRLSLDAVVFTNNVVQGGEFGGETKHPGGGGSGLGGALAVELSPGALSNSIIRSVFSENRAYGATRTVRDLTRSHADGGALYCGRGSLSIEQTLFSQNVALGGPGYGYAGNPAFGDGRGGAIFNRDGELTIRDSAIVFNQANGGSLPELWSVFNAGAAGTAWGGAIHNHGTLAVRNSTLSENVATGGAGYAYALPGPGYGGAILNEGSISLLNVTMGKNYANAGSAGGYQGPAEARGDALATVSGTVALTNTILFSAQGRTNVWGTILDGGHNISSDGSALFTSPTSKNNVDPLLGPLGNNGGLTLTMPLLFGSPAINTADAVACPSTDQRGIQRPVGEGCDIGAFEFTPTLRLARQPGGTVTIIYQFEAGQTNRISGSTNLTDWEPLGTRVTDAHGTFELADPESTKTPMRFYKVEPSD